MVRSPLPQPAPPETRSSRRDQGDGASTGRPPLSPAGYGTPQLLNVRESAAALGIKPATLYDWLGRSDRGLLVIRGQAVTIQYFQGGAAGQGRILLEYAEILRLRELMRVRPCPVAPRRVPAPATPFPGITVPLGRPRQL